MIFRISLCAMMLGGCASSFEKVRESIAEAPAWYTESKIKSSDANYPKLGGIPALTEADRTPGDTNRSRSALSESEILLRMDPRAVPPGLELEQMLQWAKQARENFSNQATASDHLTDEQAQMLRDSFKDPRGALS